MENSSGPSTDLSQVVATATTFASFATATATFSCHVMVRSPYSDKTTLVYSVQPLDGNAPNSRFWFQTPKVKICLTFTWK